MAIGFCSTLAYRVNHGLYDGLVGMLSAWRRVPRLDSKSGLLRSDLRYRRYDAGFTLVELLVVMAIIAVLVAILLPVLQAGREASQLTQCKTRLRNVGVALLSYQTTNRRFPPGADSKADPIQASTPHNFFRWSALAHLTPYLEEQSAHDLIDFDAPMYRDNKLNPAVVTAVATRLESYLCPSDRQTLSISDNGAIRYGPTNYVICSGSGINGGTPYDTDGVFYVNSATSIDDIRDGTGYTILASESTLGTGKESMGVADRISVNAQTDYATPLLFGTSAILTEDRCRSPQGWNISNRRGFFWASGEYRCAMYNHHRMPNDPMIDCIGSRAMPSEDIRTRFSAFGWRAARSQHSGGVNILLADGSVHFIDQSIDPYVWRAASTCDESEVFHFP